MQRQWDTEDFEQPGPAELPQPATPGSYSLQLSLLIALFLDQALYLHSFRQLKGRHKVFPESFGSPLSLAQNNPHAKVAHFGVASSAPLQAQERIGLPQTRAIQTIRKQVPLRLKEESYTFQKKNTSLDNKVFFSQMESRNRENTSYPEVKF